MERLIATWAHRASGDTILVLAHTVFGCLVLAALALKVIAVRVGGSHSPLLPWLGAALFALFVATWLTRRRLPRGRLMERIDQRLDAREERAKEREDRREEAEKRHQDPSDSGGGSGPG